MIRQSAHPTMRHIVIHKGGNGRPWTEDDEKELKRLHKMGLTDLEMGAEMDRQAGIISRHRRIMGLPVNVAPPKPSGPSEKQLPVWKIREMTGSKPSTLEEATSDLGERLVLRVLRGDAIYVLDGKIGATVQMIIHAANKLRLAEGKPILGRVMP